MVMVKGVNKLALPPGSVISYPLENFLLVLTVLQIPFTPYFLRKLLLFCSWLPVRKECIW
ncbi:ATP6AP2 isoform 10 [Pan troglodytes]|uniref:ATPase H+ transporting accessory protein 2 n=2 Tax=Homininae TaxID=207598 RepID=A0A1B0GTD6_HUMAN|nr:ATPase H+ transporting accessory protein 2 [Homo sapiens]KAI3999285.1 ATPase H+ transporting accessory protein 2 [Homo sapiens]PNI14537.1 ATP6AP2 isoform 10 [Pan troglodytes]